ncbi:unnamed protein product [Mytilus coruscus]|uniref:Uncharacterized protein n=1 Tax=Mytilus coruscus TaxID=42192 RepID=A0A6J8CCK6_MYTCO|nr:unnamed protein product [Mytilus coruscus]
MRQVKVKIKESESIDYNVSDRDIKKEQLLLQAAKLKPIPGTMKLHQLIFQKDYEIAQKNISSTCQEPTYCSFCTGQDFKYSRIMAYKKTARKYADMLTTEVEQYLHQTPASITNGSSIVRLNDRLRSLKEKCTDKYRQSATTRIITKLSDLDRIKQELVLRQQTDKERPINEKGDR